jgi:hypothetical protein
VVVEVEILLGVLLKGLEVLVEQEEQVLIIVQELQAQQTEAAVEVVVKIIQLLIQVAMAVQEL